MIEENRNTENQCDIKWVEVGDSLPDHLEKVEVITGVLNRAGGLNEWNTYGIIMYEVTHWARIKPPCGMMV